MDFRLFGKVVSSSAPLEEDFVLPQCVAVLVFPRDEAVKSALSRSLKDFAWPEEASEVMKRSSAAVLQMNGLFLTPA